MRLDIEQGQWPVNLRYATVVEHHHVITMFRTRKKCRNIKFSANRQTDRPSLCSTQASRVDIPSECGDEEGALVGGLVAQMRYQSKGDSSGLLGDYEATLNIGVLGI